MREIVEDFSLSPLLKAMEANANEGWIRLGRAAGAVVHDEPDLLWFYSGLPFHLANGIVRADFPSDTVEETLERRLKQLTAQGVPMAWLIGPSTRPVNLGSHLQQHGWMLDDTAPGMAVDLRSLDEQFSVPPLFTIERVSDVETLKTWLRIMTVGSEIPEEGLTLLLDVTANYVFSAPIRPVNDALAGRAEKEDSDVHYYLGLLDNEPVATSLLFLAGGVAGIYNVATLPEFRQRGIGTAQTVAPLLDARAWGYRIGTLQSTQMGLHLYLRLGFQEYCTFNAYFWSGEQQEEIF